MQSPQRVPMKMKERIMKCQRKLIMLTKMNSNQEKMESLILGGEVSHLIMEVAFRLQLKLYLKCICKKGTVNKNFRERF